MAKEKEHGNSGNFAENPERAAEAGRKGCQAQSAENNPGNFANDREKASEAGKKGGENSHDGKLSCSLKIGH